MLICFVFTSCTYNRECFWCLNSYRYLNWIDAKYTLYSTRTAWSFGLLGIWQLLALFFMPRSFLVSLSYLTVPTPGEEKKTRQTSMNLFSRSLCKHWLEYEWANPRKCISQAIYSTIASCCHREESYLLLSSISCLVTNEVISERADKEKWAIAVRSSAISRWELRRTVLFILLQRQRRANMLSILKGLRLGIIGCLP